MVDNPFFEARIALKKTQVEVSEATAVRPEFIIRLEQGIMRSVPERIVEVYREQMGLSENWHHQYKRFQSVRRRAATPPHPRQTIDSPNPPRPNETVMPDLPNYIPMTFERWRTCNWPTMSRSKWCKEFCVHPATLYAVEANGQTRFPHEIRCAILDSGFVTVGQMDELINRISFDRARMAK